MNKQEVIKAIKSLKNIVEYWTCRPTEVEAAKIAISALEKQIPKKPDKDDCCTTCSTYLKDDNDVEGDYCPNCGQAIDWRNEDE